MAANRTKKLMAGVVLGGLVGGVTLGSVLRTASAGPGDPPVIVLPSAKAAAKVPVVPTLVQAQATSPVKTPVMPTLELLPLPQSAEPPIAAKSAPVAAPPLLVTPAPTLQTAPIVPTVTAKEAVSPPPIVVKEIAPSPRAETIVAKTVEVLPLPATGPVPSSLAPPGDTAMKPATAALTALIAAAAPAAEPKQVVEKITDYAKTDDVKSLKDEVEALRKQMATLTGATADVSKSTDVKALKEEVESLKKAITGLSGTNIDQAKAGDVKTLKDEIALLKKEIATLTAKPGDGKGIKDEIESLRKDVATLSAKPGDGKGIKDEIESLRKDVAALSAKPGDGKAIKEEIDALRKDLATLSAKPTDTKAMKDEVDALRKDVATLNTYLCETLEGKVDRGFTHEGVVKRLQKLDESLAAMSKKVETLDGKIAEPRTVGSSPLTRGPEAMPKNQGIVHIVNDYPIEIAIVVNGASHRLDPHTKKDIAVAAGSFKYQLLTSGGAETERSIKDNETVTLTIK